MNLAKLTADQENSVKDLARSTPTFRGLGSQWVALFVVVVVGMLPVASQATVIPTYQTGGPQSFFDGFISSTDLIQAGSATLSGSVVASAPGSFPAGGANNGNAVQTSGLSYWGGNLGSVDLTYNLTGSATGFDITSVNSIYGWQDVRYRHAAQEWQLFVSTVAVPTFTSIYSVVYAPWAANDGAQGSTMVTLADSTGVLATGVTALRFHLTPYSSPGMPGYTGEIGVVREFDVFGTVSGPSAVPDSATSTVGLLGMAGLLGVFFRRMNRRMGN